MPEVKNTLALLNNLLAEGTELEWSGTWSFVAQVVGACRVIVRPRPAGVSYPGHAGRSDVGAAGLLALDPPDRAPAAPPRA